MSSFTTRRVAAIAALALITPIGTGIAFADGLETDGDDLIDSAGVIDLGNICTNAIKSGQTSLAIRRTGSGTNVFANDAVVSFTTPTVAGNATVSAAQPSGIQLPFNWRDQLNGTFSPISRADVTVTAGSDPAPTQSATVSYMASGHNGAGSTILRPDTLSVKWNVVSCAPADTTAPVVTPTITGDLGTDGWYTSDVAVSWSVSDPESAITSPDCNPTTITSDTANQVVSCSATSSGGTTSNSVTIKRDATAPTISAAVSPAAAVTGWYNNGTGAPTVTYTCNDTNLATCTSAHTFGDGTNQSHTGTATDAAGNTATANVTGINVDRVAPGVTWNGGINNGDSFYFGGVPDEPTCTSTDGLSGPDGCSVTGYSTAVGTHTLTASAHDVAGNTTPESREYTVKAWNLSGFYQPVDMNGVLNTVKSGSTVPLKFEVFVGSTELTSTTAIASFKTAVVSCGSLVVNGVDEIEITSTGATSLRYDTTGGQFIQNWQTPKNKAGTCYRVTMTTQDGSAIVAYFQLK